MTRDGSSLQRAICSLFRCHSGKFFPEVPTTSPFVPLYLSVPSFPLCPPCTVSMWTSLLNKRSSRYGRTVETHLWGEVSVTHGTAASSPEDAALWTPCILGCIPTTSLEPPRVSCLDSSQPLRGAWADGPFPELLTIRSGMFPCVKLTCHLSLPDPTKQSLHCSPSHLGLSGPQKY